MAGNGNKKKADVLHEIDKGSGTCSESQKAVGQGPIATPRVTSVRRGRKRPQWESGTLPIFGRVNLRPLGSLIGILFLILAAITFWAKFLRKTAKHGTETQALARYGP